MNTKPTFRIFALAAICSTLFAPWTQAQPLYGDAILFNYMVNNQYVTVSNFGTIIPTNEITVEFWAVAYGFAVQSAFQLNPDQNNNRFNAHIDYGSSPGQTYWDFGNISGGGRVFTTSPPNSIENWVHYALVASQSGNYMRIYTNGVLQISQAGMTPFTRGNYNLQIAGPGFPFTGILDELRIWSAARTPYQIQADMYSPLAGNETNLVVYYKFDSASGTIVTNSATATGAAFNGILSNNPTWVASTIPLVVNEVTSTGDDSNPGRLRNVVANAPSGSIVVFAPTLSGQVITLTNGPIALNKNITIDATELSASVQINANFLSKIFTISSATVALNSLVLTEGHGSFGTGGDIQINSGNITINNCVFTDSEAYEGQGGAIANLGGTTTINSSTFSANYATITPGYGADQGQTGGGAIYNGQANLTLNNCSFTGNFADSSSGGGAIWCNGTLPVIVNSCTFSGNSAIQTSGGGGAIYYQSGASLIVSNSTFFGNLADNSGGGGGIYNQSGSGLAVDNCTFYGNTATNANFGGGAVCDRSGVNLAVSDCTIVANTATTAGSGGGGIYTIGNLAITNTIVCSNTAPSGPEAFCAANLSLVGSLVGPEAFSLHEGSLVVNSGNQFSASPLLAPLANYGGPTQTMLPLPSSPCINAGVNAVTSFLTTDQRGLPRKSGANVDIGAVEVQPSDTNTLVTTTADSGLGSLRLAASLASSGASSRITFTNSLSGQTILLTNGQIVLSSNVTVDASALANGIKIDGHFRSRIFEIASNATVVLNSLTLTNGSDDTDTNYGGGALLNFGTLTISNCAVIDNHANFSYEGGGGIDNRGTLTMNNCIISDNESGYSEGGGGIVSFGPLAATNCTVSGNNAENSTDGGGGIDIQNGSLTMNNCIVSSNQANDGGDGGGGIDSYGTVTANNCTFSGNQANDAENGGGGGIVSLTSATITINNSTFADNQANGCTDGGGGGINCAGTLTVNNSTFTGNQANNCTLANAYAGGGGIFGGYLTVNNCTFDGNQAVNSGDDGGGILSVVGTSGVTNCIFYMNNASSLGTELANIGGNLTVDYCLLGPEVVGEIYTSGTTVLTNSLVGVNPLLAPLGNYGGPTQTMPPEPGSPAIDAGTDSVTSFLITDQRGETRKVGAHVDIGAVEDQSGQSYSIVENTLDNGPGSLRQVISNAPFGATVTFDPSLAGQTITLTSGQIILSNSVYLYATGLTNGVQINGHGTSRIFQVNTGTTAILYGLILTNGNPGANFGGAIFNSSGTLLELIACTIAGNTSSQGGAIENEGTCVLLECTITGNHAVATGGGSGNGGAIDNNQGPLQLLQCTIVSNTSTGLGGGVANYLTTLAITNSIIANNSPQDTFNFASSTLNAGGTNIVIAEAAQGGSTNNGVSSLLGFPPILAPLGNYGGLTPTMPPLHGSPAIDGGSAAALSSEGFTLDQRGYPRVSGARVDIGAVEDQIASANFPLTGLTTLGSGSFQFNLPSLVGGSFTVFATTNLALPFNTWSNLGPVLETPVGSGVFQFTDTQATNYPRRFYRVSSP
jgi:hypothetical protein